jgi:multidrug transporter EmrE-like cation transporter
MAWIVLVVSGLLETAWAAALNASQGFTRFWPSLTFAVTLVLSLTWAITVWSADRYIARARLAGD